MDHAIGRIALALLVLGPVAPGLEGPARALHLRLSGEARHAGLRDLDGDGRPDLVLVTREGTTRTLHVFLQRRPPASPLFGAEPDARYPVPDAAAFFLSADFLPPPHHLGFLTRDALLPAGEGAKPLLGFPPFFPGPDPTALYEWRGARDLDGDGRADLLVPAPGGYAVARQLPSGGFAKWEPIHAAPRVTVSTPRARFLATETSLPVPVFRDWDGDGKDDLLLQDGTDLAVRLARPGEPLRAFPDVKRPLLFLKLEAPGREDGTGTQSIDVDDVDGDHKTDLVAVVRSGRVGLFESFQTRIFLFPGAAPPERPAQILTLQGVGLRPRLFDFDGDRKLDLLVPVVRVDLLSNLKKALFRSVRTTFRIHLFDPKRGRFEEDPELVWDVDAAVSGLEEGGAPPMAFFHGDFDGDGKKDLLLCQEGRRMEVRRGTKEGGFLRKTRVGYEGSAWWKDEVPYSANLWLQDLDGDGRTDLFTWSGNGATVITFPEKP